MITPGELNHYIDVYDKVKFKNKLNEDDYRFEKIKSTWAKITLSSGVEKTGQGDTKTGNISYSIIVRDSSLPTLSKNMHFVFKKQRYNIKYFNPIFKFYGFVEIVCNLEV